MKVCVCGEGGPGCGDLICTVCGLGSVARDRGKYRADTLDKETWGVASPLGKLPPHAAPRIFFLVIRHNICVRHSLCIFPVTGVSPLP